ncbi:cytidine deaminase [Ruficoccus amylovorans]|uniref:Cytidine deaminase n=1 Tax=Ruficoccus amylovorans TaxID=1804625 RepID=A0A842HDE5_9BACT|nr:cytidine deaminase [Ruficoccus amylovorans]MBC2594555.1 cytidine deaminase [Ruficoccus amylovorans]
MPEQERYLQDFQRLEQAKAFACVPVSGYQVGALLVTEEGRLFPGANLEFPGLPPNYCVHAEQAAAAAALLAGCREWRQLLVSAAPCGHCRQFLREFDPGSLRVRVVESPTIASVSTLGKLLPQAFGAEAFLPDAKGADDQLPTPAPVPGTPASGSPIISNLESAARQALARSHAPYSGNRAVAVLAGGGVLIAGASFENAAYNPGLGPMQAALSQWRLAGHDFAAIERVWLVQSDPSRVSWEAQSREILASVSASPLTASVR